MLLTAYRGVGGRQNSGTQALSQTGNMRSVRTGARITTLCCLWLQTRLPVLLVHLRVSVPAVSAGLLESSKKIAATRTRPASSDIATRRFVQKRKAGCGPAVVFSGLGVCRHEAASTLRSGRAHQKRAGYRAAITAAPLEGARRERPTKAA